MMLCTACDGESRDEEGCERCAGSGHELLRGCPRKLTPGWVRRVIQLAGDAERGSMPVAGGVLAQSHSFNVARRFVRSERARIERERWESQRRE